jgi:hypothetical protein
MVGLTQRRERDFASEGGRYLQIATESWGGASASTATAAKTIAIKPDALYKLLIAKEPSVEKDALVASVPSVPDSKGNKWVELASGDVAYQDGKGGRLYMEHAKAVAYLNADADGREKMLANIALFTKKEVEGVTLDMKLIQKRSTMLFVQAPEEGQEKQYNGGKKRAVVGYAIIRDGYALHKDDDGDAAYYDKEKNEVKYEENGKTLNYDRDVVAPHVAGAIRRADKLIFGMELDNDRRAAAYFVSLVIGSGDYLKTFVEKYITAGESAAAALEAFTGAIKPGDGSPRAISPGAITYNNYNFGDVYSKELFEGTKSVQFTDTGLRFELEKEKPETKEPEKPKQVALTSEQFLVTISATGKMPASNRELRDGVIGAYVKWLDEKGVEHGGIVRGLGTKEGAATLKVTGLEEDQYVHSKIKLDAVALKDNPIIGFVSRDAQDKPFDLGKGSMESLRDFLFDMGERGKSPQRALNTFMLDGLKAAVVLVIAGPGKELVEFLAGREKKENRRFVERLLEAEASDIHGLADKERKAAKEEYHKAKHLLKKVEAGKASGEEENALAEHLKALVDNRLDVSNWAAEKKAGEGGAGKPEPALEKELKQGTGTGKAEPAPKKEGKVEYGSGNNFLTVILGPSIIAGSAELPDKEANGIFSGWRDARTMESFFNDFDKPLELLEARGIIIDLAKMTEADQEWYRSQICKLIKLKQNRPNAFMPEAIANMLMRMPSPSVPPVTEIGGVPVTGMDYHWMLSCDQNVEALKNALAVYNKENPHYTLIEFDEHELGKVVGIKAGEQLRLTRKGGVGKCLIENNNGKLNMFNDRIPKTELVELTEEEAKTYDYVIDLPDSSALVQKIDWLPAWQKKALLGSIPNIIKELQSDGVGITASVLMVEITARKEELRIDW